MRERIRLGRTGYQISPVGFGSYRVQEGEPAHEAALRLALASGCNLVDTSANYGDGGSERVIGGVLRDLIGRGELRREDVVVVSKAGYLQGQNLSIARTRITEGRPFTDMVKYSPDLWHCISPDFLEDQLTRSLERLGLESIDAYLLHNPEYFLKRSGDTEEYYKRVGRAFEHLEGEAKRGRIRHYGISSNTFPEPPEHSDHTSLARAWELATALGENHHFSVIQFPFNLFEQGAVEEKNGVARLAAKLDVGTLVNRPLNAFSGESLFRLADFPSHDPEGLQSRLREALEKTMTLEARFPAGALPREERPAWGHVIDENIERLQDLDTWRGALRHQIEPQLAQALGALSRAPEGVAWGREYETQVRALFAGFTAFLESRAAARSLRIVERLVSAAPELGAERSLSRMAVRVCRSFPGIDAVLVGMRRPEYVRDLADLDAVEGALDESRARAALRGIQALSREFARDDSPTP